MEEPRDIDALMEDDYDEEADGDFEGEIDDEDSQSNSSSDGDSEPKETIAQRPKKRRKPAETAQPATQNIELDSGDEDTIQQQKKFRKKGTQTGGRAEDSEESGQEWRARTRAMRERDKEQKKQSKLASIRGSTIDVDKIWEEMNRPASSVGANSAAGNAVNLVGMPDGEVPPASQPGLGQSLPGTQSQENAAPTTVEEMITIKRTYKFAGQITHEEKVVPKSSAEAQLYLAQQSTKSQAVTSDGKAIRRPLRKISRFDPNINNLGAFRVDLPGGIGRGQAIKATKLNVVEVSKQDWAAAVDAGGFREELEKGEKSREGYHARREFLNRVEQNQEEISRNARLAR